MSSQSQDQDPYSALVSEYSSLLINNYCSIAAIVLFLHDFLVTYTDEVVCFWRGNWTGATVLFFLSRYVALLSTLFEFIYGFVPCTDCMAGTKAGVCLQMAKYLLWAAFSGLRSYALSRQMFISGIVFSLSIVPICTNLVDVLGFYQITCIPEAGCTVMDTIGPRLSHAYVYLTIASRGSLIAADIILISITWATLGRRTAMTSRPTFARVILLDGECLFILNVLHLSFTLTSAMLIKALNPSTQFESNIVLFTEPLTSILIWRFMLDLQTVNSGTIHLDSQGAAQDRTSSLADSLVFERTVGSLVSFATASRHVDADGREPGSTSAQGDPPAARQELDKAEPSLKDNTVNT
ncbi:hypothetical protein BD311DRAFT_760901 [Dichomitus squalens]|uniref:DUF6533 domain-containing protein n=1 Tax=Dichomitus squalens TaxID=114155 RepID=A0A4Q9MIB8_9APHY|nr:hypothetical protein BD311DRAFT_760901 [Dichomitus squalens]